MKFIQAIKWFFQGDTQIAKRARQAAKVVWIVILFAGLFLIIPFKDVIQNLWAVDPLYLTFGLILGFVSLYLDAVKQFLLARKQGIIIGVNQFVTINLEVKFYLLFAPGALVGSGLRWYKIAKENGKTAEALVVVAFNRLLEIFMIISLGLVFWLISNQESINMNNWLLVGLIFFIFVLWLALTRLSMPISNRFERLVKQSQKTLLKSIYRRSQKFFTALAAYRDVSLWEILLVFWVALSRHVVGWVSFVFVARSMGLSLSILDLGWIRAIILLASTLPISFAGGLGVREISMIALFALFGVGADIALAFSMLIFAKGLLLSIVGGVLEAINALHPEPAKIG